MLFQGSLFLQHSPAPVADAFCASRLDGGAAAVFGTLPAGIDTTAIIERHRPTL